MEKYIKELLKILPNLTSSKRAHFLNVATIFIWVHDFPGKEFNEDEAKKYFYKIYTNTNNLNIEMFKSYFNEYGFYIEKYLIMKRFLKQKDDEQDEKMLDPRFTKLASEIDNLIEEVDKLKKENETLKEIVIKKFKGERK
jgi:hypothetical protein